MGLPLTVKGFLAVHQNPRPAGIVLRHCTMPINKWPWNDLPDESWTQEMRNNNGNLISVLLRHPDMVSDRSFLAIFDNAETEYKALLKRLKWESLTFSGTTRRKEILLGKLRGVLEWTVEAFVDWATKNRAKVWNALQEIATNEEYAWGNAVMDLERIDLAKEWGVIDRAEAARETALAGEHRTED